MKIALINSLYKPYRRGGAEVVFSNIAAELKNDGHDIFIITISGKKEKTNFEVSEKYGIKVFRFYPRNIFSFLDIGKKPEWQRLLWHLIDTFNFHSYFQVRKILHQQKPDLVLTHNLKGLGYLTLRAIKKEKIKNIHTLHDVQLADPSGLIIWGKEKQNWLNKIYAKITRRLFDSPYAVVSPSKWLLDFYINYGFFPKSKKLVLPNPLILNAKDFTKKFTDDRVNYLFLGQLEKHKGILLLLDAFEEFCKTQSQARLMIVGQGKLETRLKDKYAGCPWVEFKGFVPHEELDTIFEQVHYTVLPSLCYENSPSVIYDSFKYGTPVIASAIGGAPELIQEGVNGYLFEPANKFNLLNDLKLSLQNIANFENMSENAKMKAGEYDIKNYVYRILSL